MQNIHLVQTIHLRGRIYRIMNSPEPLSGTRMTGSRTVDSKQITPTKLAGASGTNSTTLIERSNFSVSNQRLRGVEQRQRQCFAIEPLFIRGPVCVARCAAPSVLPQLLGWSWTGWIPSWRRDMTLCRRVETWTFGRLRLWMNKHNLQLTSYEPPMSSLWIA